MGQAEILHCLGKQKEPICRLQIAELMDMDPNRVSKAIKILLTKNEIKCIELDRNETAKRLKLKKPHRRTRFYYV